MKKTISAISAACFLLLATACSHQDTSTTMSDTTNKSGDANTLAPTSGSDNGMWVRDSRNHLSSRKSIHTLLENIEEEGITNLYISFHKDDGLADEYTYLNQLAHQKGIRVFATIGEPSWGTKKEVNTAVEYIEAIAQFNDTKEAEGHFDGIMLDVKPYDLTGVEMHSENRGRLLEEWHQNSITWKEHAEANNLLLYGAFPYWLDTSSVINDYYTSPNNRPFYEDMLDVYDGYTVFAYSNELNEIFANSLGELKSAETFGKPIYITLETGTGDGFSFYHSFNKWSKKKLRVFTELLNEQGQTYPSYQGYIVHHYDDWNEMNNS